MTFLFRFASWGTLLGVRPTSVFNLYSNSDSQRLGVPIQHFIVYSWLVEVISVSGCDCTLVRLGYIHPDDSDGEKLSRVRPPAAAPYPSRYKSHLPETHTILIVSIDTRVESPQPLSSCSGMSFAFPFPSHAHRPCGMLCSGRPSMPRYSREPHRKKGRPHSELEAGAY